MPANERRTLTLGRVPGSALALVLGAALIHAAWNALAKRAQDQLVFLWSSVSLATLALVPVGLALLPPEGVSSAAAPYLAATIAIHAVYFYALSRAYGSGDFSLVYPIARGLGVALVPLVAWLALDERLSTLGSLGVALVVAGIAAIGAGPGAPRGERRVAGAGTGWALVTGLSIAGYSVVDKAGVGRLHPVPYIAIMGVGMSLLLAPSVWSRRAALAAEWRANWRAVVAASALNLTSYLLVLFAFRLSKAGYVVAARELSIVLSVLIGRLWLGEAQTRGRLAAAVIIMAGVACVALA
jgi:drug/metabolite transporter (DMT)-like permease